MAGSKSIGKYEILEEVGRGGFSVVYRARDTESQRIVALKILHPYWTADPNFTARFRHEAHAAAQLQHPRIVKIYEAGTAEGQLYTAMEYLPGRTLRALLEEEGALSLEQALPILDQIAKAMDYAHDRGMIHRDVKPSNVMVEETEQGLRVTLLDFGLVKAMEGSTALTSQGTLLGSPEYMAPEQADPERAAEIGPATDLYALGIVAYQMLTGRVPFLGHSLATLNAHVRNPVPRPRSLCSDLPRAVESTLLKMLAKAPADRFASANAFITQLEEALLHPQRVQLSSRSWVVGAVLVVLLGSGGLLGWVARQERGPLAGLLATPTLTPTPTAPPTDTPTPTLTSTAMPKVTPSLTSEPIATRTTRPTHTRTPMLTPTTTPTNTPTHIPTSTPTSYDGSSTPTSTTSAPPTSPTPSLQPSSVPGSWGSIFYTVQADQMYYLASTNPSWSQGQLIDPTTHELSTCAGGVTARTLAGQSVNLYYGHRCDIVRPTECTSPDGQYKVTIWESGGDYSVSIYRASDNELVRAVYNGSLTDQVPIMWAPDSSRFYFTIKNTLHQASPYSAGYQPVIPNVHEPYLSPDGSMILYLQPVGTIGAYDIWVADADGYTQNNVTNDPQTYKLCPRWGW